MRLPLVVRLMAWIPIASGSVSVRAAVPERQEPHQTAGLHECTRLHHALMRPRMNNHRPGSGVPMRPAGSEPRQTGLLA